MFCRRPPAAWLAAFLMMLATGLGMGGMAWYGHYAAVVWLDSPKCGFSVSDWKGWPCTLEVKVSRGAHAEMTWSRWILGAYPAKVSWDKKKKLPDTEGRELRKLRGIQSLDVSGAPGLTASFFADIGTYQQMSIMRAAYTDYDDACAAYLALLPRLQRLDIRYTYVTGEHLPTLPELTHLDASDSVFTDAGCRRLAGCAKLRVVHLQGTAVTLEGIRALVVLPQLEELGLPENLDKSEAMAVVGRTGRKVALW